VLQREARVAYTRENQAALIFLSQTLWEIRKTIEFIASISDASAPTTGMRFP
jgi:hypothetical protein